MQWNGNYHLSACVIKPTASSQPLELRVKKNICGWWPLPPFPNVWWSITTALKAYSVPCDQSQMPREISLNSFEVGCCCTVCIQRWLLGLCSERLLAVLGVSLDRYTMLGIETGLHETDWNFFCMKYTCNLVNYHPNSPKIISRVRVKGG